MIPYVYEVLLYYPAILRVLVAQWIERPPGVRKVVGSNPVMGSDFFWVLLVCKKKTES